MLKIVCECLKVCEPDQYQNDCSVQAVSGLFTST